MQHAPSRRERRESKFYYLAEKGKFEADAFLFKSEAKNLTKMKGFIVVRQGTDEKKSVPSIVSWKEAFNKGVPLIVSDYITGKIETFPKVSNWAQELYVIAARANYVKGTNINE